MSQTPQQQGTTPDVLQQYIAADIQVKTPHGVAELWGISKSLRTAGGYSVEVRSHLQLSEAPTIEEITLALQASDFYSITDVLPVLRPFSSLMEPLEDGTVPAKHFVELNNDLCCDPKRHLKIERGVLWMDKHGNKDWRDIFSARDFALGYCDNRAANYLRSLHFAVGLEPHQYIPKSVSRPTIEEGGKP